MQSWAPGMTEQKEDGAVDRFLWLVFFIVRVCGELGDPTVPTWNFSGVWRSCDVCLVTEVVAITVNMICYVSFLL